jgi:pimeloyl-ACP methyl ester carboxylesterase
MTPDRNVVVTIPGMPYINHDQYDIDGIRVERFTTAPKDAAQRPPLICVHGDCHASWSWQEHAAVYAAAGYEVHALNWRGRGGSAAKTERITSLPVRVNRWARPSAFPEDGG